MLLKKAAVAVLGTAVGLFAVSQTSAPSYVGTAWGKLTGSLSKKVPIEFELDRIKYQVAQLIPDLERNKSLLADDMATVDALRKEIDTIRGKLTEKKKAIGIMADDLDSGRSVLRYDGKDYPAERIKTKLAADLASYKAADAELKTKELTLAAKEKTLEAVKQQLLTVNDTKRQLEVQIAELEAELSTIKLAESKNQYHVDDSRLADIQKSLADVRKQLQARKTKQALDAEFANDVINVEKRETAKSDPVKEARELLGQSE
jgi:chromosome segregation ATPase